MKVLICGSRSITDYGRVKSTIDDSGFKITTVISGGANGVDTCAEQYAKAHKKFFEKYPAEWDKYGRGAGMIRNKIMVEKADAVIAIWDGISKGTKHSINYAKKLGKQLHICYVGDVFFDKTGPSKFVDLPLFKKIENN